MKKFLLPALLSVLIVGCSSTPVEETGGAPVESRKDAGTGVAQVVAGGVDANGLPIEIYCFTNTVVWAEYEGIQADIFDHVFAVVEEFGLRIHQTPTGNDIRALAGAFSR